MNPSTIQLLILWKMKILFEGECRNRGKIFPPEETRKKKCNNGKWKMTNPREQHNIREQAKKSISIFSIERDPLQRHNQGQKCSIISFRRWAHNPKDLSSPLFLLKVQFKTLWPVPPTELEELSLLASLMSTRMLVCALLESRESEVFPLLQSACLLQIGFSFL